MSTSRPDSDETLGHVLVANGSMSQEQPLRLALKRGVSVKENMFGHVQSFNGLWNRIMSRTPDQRLNSAQISKKSDLNYLWYIPKRTTSKPALWQG